MTRLTTALNGYNRAYIDSFLMTMDEVLQFIPEDQHKLYKLSCRDDSYNLNSTYAYKSYVEEKKEWKVFNKGKKNEKHEHVLVGTKVIPASKYAYLLPANKKDGNANLPLDVALHHLFEPNELKGMFADDAETKRKRIKENERVFMVDIDNKLVEICPWAVNKSRGVSYTGKMTFDLDENKNLTLRCEYTYCDYQQVGGSKIMCQTGYSYFRGGKTETYERIGNDVYKFCTRTNKFLGYIGTETKKDKRASWLKTSGW